MTIMEKVRQYESSKIEICRNCGGKGMVKPEKGFFERMLDCPHRMVPCPVCNGSGRVEKHTAITVTVRSFQ